MSGDDLAIGEPAFPSFDEALAEQGLELSRDVTRTVQINVGLTCNLACTHCHLEAGPHRTEMMDAATARQVVGYVGRGRFDVVDITGGAPEMNPNLPMLIEAIRPHCKTLMARTNLTILTGAGRQELLQVMRANEVTLIGSLPSLNRRQAESQRGVGTFDQSIEALRLLNNSGYGVDGSGLTLDLVANPAGAFLAPNQAEQERRFRAELKRRYGVEFNRLFALSNVPLGRFGNWLQESGNLANYYQKLADSFNPNSLPGVMCRTQVSINWDGYLYDCDFHLAKGIDMADQRTHVSQMGSAPLSGSPIAMADYCYTCVAGAGFTCGGSIEDSE